MFLKMRHVKLAKILNLLFFGYDPSLFLLASGVGMIAQIVKDMEIDHADARDECIDTHQ